jgi:hypothetical protein
MKFGRRPPVHNRHTMRAALAMARALDPLGVAPTVSNDYVTAVDAATGGDWGMMGNDSVGDCTYADCGHQVMLHTANAGTIIVPTAAQVLALYSAITGYVPGDEATDQGADEHSVCQYMMETGLCGQVSAGSGQVDPTNLDHLRWTVQLFGACRLGITVGQDSIQQFSSHQPWESVTTDPNAGGHDVPIVKYDEEYAYVVTWGGLQAVSWGLIQNPQFLEEAHAEVYPDWVRASGTAPSGFALNALLSDLAAIAAA